MKPREEALHLIVIDDSSNDAETVSNLLRNAGQAVRVVHVEDAEDLRRTLKTQPCDMVVSKLDIPFFSAEEAVGIVQDLKLDVPVIVLEDPSKRERVLACLRAGARDCVLLSEPARLEHVLLREFSDLQHRRNGREYERLLAESNTRAQALVETSRDAIAYVHDGMHIYANESYLQMFGYADFAEIEGMPLMNMIAPDDQVRFKDFLRHLTKGSTAVETLEICGFDAQGGEFRITMEFSPTSYEGEACIQVVIRDQTLSRELEKKLDDMSKQDLLTGLYNRQFFLDSLQQVVGGGRHQGALLFIEPDQFRRLREELGIATSDLLIADLAGVLQQALGETDACIARFDSQVFTILLPGVDSTAAEAIAKRIPHILSEHLAEIGGRTISFSCSIGIGLFDDTMTDPQEVLARAEKARRKAADAGGNQVSVYNPAVEEMAEKERMAMWAKKLKLALRDNRFYLVFQPIVSLRGDANENYEVYLRMVDDGRNVDPAEFIRVAQQTGLMVAIDRWVLHHAVKMLVERARTRGKRTNLFVNLSEASVRDTTLLAWMRDLLKAARIDGSNLVIEVAESSAQANLKVLKPLFEGLKHLHVRTSLDHFGVASNATNLLRHLHADVLKLDGNLVSQVTRDPHQQLRLKELTAYARENNCRTVAEFVEDANTLAALWSCGVDYIQGYFLQRPERELHYEFSTEGF